MFVTGPIPIHVQYDGTKKDRYGLVKRVLKKFKNGLSREAKDFYLEKAREGKSPQVLAGDLSPVFGRWSRHTPKPEPAPAPPPAPAPEPEPVIDTLFDLSPDQLPD